MIESAKILFKPTKLNISIFLILIFILLLIQLVLFLFNSRTDVIILDGLDYSRIMSRFQLVQVEFSLVYDYCPKGFLCDPDNKRFIYWNRPATVYNSFFMIALYLVLSAYFNKILRKKKN